MKVAVSATEKHLEALVDPLFGRSACFVIVETSDMSFEAFDNPNISLAQAAGIESARFVSSKAAQVVITGNCGPKAVKELSNDGIELIVGVMGTVRQVVDKYRSNDFVSTEKANVKEYFGRCRIDDSEKNISNRNDDSGHYYKNKPWFRAVKKQQEKSDESKGVN